MSYEATESGILVPKGMVEPAYKSTNPLNRLVSEWNPPSEEVDDSLLPALDTLRDQCRDLDRNESVARGSVENIVCNVVGEGLWPQAKLNHEMLGISEKEARAFENQAENIFRLVAESTAIDYLGRSTFPELQDQVLRAQLIDGDVLSVRRQKKLRKYELLSTRVQLIPGGRLRDPGDYKGDNDIREGVELDATGEPIAYHILNRTKYDGVDFRGVDSKRISRYSKNGIIHVLHLFHKRLPDQSRGEPLLTPAIQKFKQLSRYAEAEIAAAVINAFLTTFITSDGQGPLGPRQNAHLANRGADEPKKEWTQRKLGPMTMLNLLPGEKVEAPAPGRPSPKFDSFFQSVLKQIGPSIGLPFEVLIQHFSSSYSAARAALLQAWRFFKVRRKWLEIGFCQPIYEWVIEEAILRGMIEAPGFFDNPIKRALYLKAQWIGQEMPSIDRYKDAKADEIDLKNGVTSQRQIVESRGKDYDKLKREIAANPPKNLEKKKKV